MPATTEIKQRKREGKKKMEGKKGRKRGRKRWRQREREIKNVKVQAWQRAVKLLKQNFINDYLGISKTNAEH